MKNLRTWSSAGLATLAFSLISTSAMAYPKPTDVAYKADRGMDGQIVVYRDNENPALYWYLPMIKLYTVNGKVKYLKRANSKGGFDFTFYIVPYFPEDAIDEIARAPGITNLTNRDQLQEVTAERFAVKVNLFDNVVGMGDQVTNQEYLNIPQMIRLSLTKDESDDFMQMFEASPGVPVDTMLKYSSERVDKAISVKLSYKEIFSSLGVGAGGHVYFTGLQIEDTISNLIASGDLEIHTTNNMSLRPIVEQLISQAFTPSTEPCTNPSNYNNNNNNGGSWNNSGYGYGTTTPTNSANGWSQFFLNYEPKARVTAEDWSPPASSTQPSAPVASTGTTTGSSNAGSDWGDTPTNPTNPINPTDPGTGNTVPAWSNDPRYTGACYPDTTNGGKPVQVVFSVNKQAMTRTDDFVYNEDNTQSADEIVEIPGFLAETPNAPAQDVVTPLTTRTIEVGYDARSAKPLDSKLSVQRGDRLTINAAFNLTAISPYGGGQLHYYRWDSSWGDATSQLYYRIGDGPWIAMKDGRANIGGETLQTGELQFYEDRDKLWGMIDPKLSKGPGWGIQPMYPEAKTFPIYNVQISGTHTELK